jgi:hypothetical protein
MLFWIIQILGIFGFIFYTLSFQMKTKENLLIMQAVSNVFATIQFLLTEALTGAVHTLLGVIRGFVFYFYKKRDLKPNKIVLIIFEVAIILGTVFTWENILSCLPLIGMTVNLYGQWQNDMKIVRICAVISAVLWSVYAFYAGVYMVMLTEIMKIISSIIGLWRFRKFKEKNEIKNR